MFILKITQNVMRYEVPDNEVLDQFLRLLKSKEFLCSLCYHRYALFDLKDVYKASLYENQRVNTTVISTIAVDEDEGVNSRMVYALKGTNTSFCYHLK